MIDTDADSPEPGERDAREGSITSGIVEDDVAMELRSTPNVAKLYKLIQAQHTTTGNTGSSVGKAELKT